MPVSITSLIRSHICSSKRHFIKEIITECAIALSNNYEARVYVCTLKCLPNLFSLRQSDVQQMRHVKFFASVSRGKVFKLPRTPQFMSEPLNKV